MRFLHVFSMAGVAEMMCKYGAGDKVLQLEQFDAFGFGEFYGVTEIFKDPNILLRRAEQLEPEYDKIIIHDFSEFKHSFPKSKVIFIFHGTKLRQMDEVEREAVKQYPCYVTTSDLLEILPGAGYLPNPVDLDHFKQEERGVGWICINRSYQREHIEKNIKERYPETFYYERNANNLIEYEDMPMFLSQYANYVDWKFTYDKPIPKSLPDPSCTGLQALALGLDVYDRNGYKLDRSLLLVHSAQRITEKFLNDQK